MSRQDDDPLATEPTRLIPMTTVYWAVALAGGALVVASAPSASILRCADGSTNRGQVQWWLAIAAFVVSAPALGRAAWLVIGHKGSVRLRWAAVAVAVAVPIVTIALAFLFLADAPSTGTCFD